MPFDYTTLGNPSFDYSSLAEDPTSTQSGPSQTLALRDPNNSDPSIWGVTPTNGNGPGTGNNSINHQSQVPGHLGSVPQTPDFSAISSAIQSTQSPYMTMGAHGWLQDNHPGVASGLDNALSALANLHQGTTIGQNIAAVAGSLAASRQQRQEHDVRQATLPLQIAQQQIGYQQGLQNLYHTNAQINELGQRGNYYDAQSQYRQQRIQQLDPSNLINGKPIADDNGKLWGVTKDGQQIYVGDDQLPQGYTPSFNKSLPGNRPGASGGYLGSLINGVAGPDATPQQKLSLYTNTQAQIAGGKKSATDVANQPTDTNEKFYKDQKDSALAGLGPTPNASTSKNLQDQGLLANQMGKDTYDSMYGKGAFDSLQGETQRVQNYTKNKADLTKRFGRYTQSGDWRKGKSFDPSQYGDQPASTQAAPQTQTPSNLGSALDGVFGKPRQ